MCYISLGPWITCRTNIVKITQQIVSIMSKETTNMTAEGNNKEKSACRLNCSTPRTFKRAEVIHVMTLLFLLKQIKACHDEHNLVPLAISRFKKKDPGFIWNEYNSKFPKRKKLMICWNLKLTNNQNKINCS
jgi:hypothetical protein